MTSWGLSEKGKKQLQRLDRVQRYLDRLDSIQSEPPLVHEPPRFLSDMTPEERENWFRFGFKNGPVEDKLEEIGDRLVLGPLTNPYLLAWIDCYNIVDPGDQGLVERYGEKVLQEGKGIFELMSRDDIVRYLNVVSDLRQELTERRAYWGKLGAMSMESLREGFDGLTVAFLAGVEAPTSFVPLYRSQVQTKNVDKALKIIALISTAIDLCEKLWDLGVAIRDKWMADQAKKQALEDEQRQFAREWARDNERNREFIDRSRDFTDRFDKDADRLNA